MLGENGSDAYIRDSNKGGGACLSSCPIHMQAGNSWSIGIPCPGGAQHLMPLCITLKLTLRKENARYGGLSL